MKPSRIREFMVPTWDFVKLQELRTSDEALQLALQYPRGSGQRRSLIEVALKLERRLHPHGRLPGPTKPQYLDTLPLLLMYGIALRTGERAAERLALLAWDTGLVHDKNRLKSRTYKSSTIERLAGRWRQLLTPAARKELDELTAARGGVEDPETVVRQIGDEPHWQHHPARNK